MIFNMAYHVRKNARALQRFTFYNIIVNIMDTYLKTQFLLNDE